MKNAYHSLRGISSSFSKLVLISLFGLFAYSNSQAQTYATVPFSDGFESGTIGPSWATYSSLATNGNAVIQTGTLTWTTQTAFSHTGTYFLGMHYPTGGAYNLNQCDLHLNLAGESGLRLGLWWAEWNDETEIEDGIFISDDNGVTFVKVLDLNGASYTDLTYTHFDMSLDSINAVHSLTFSSQYIIRFQQYDNFYFAGGNDGFLFDDISVYNVCGSSSIINPSVCDTYTSPSGNQTYTTSGTYTDTLTNTAGCDSLITINLSVNNNSSTLNELSCGPYTAPDGAVYAASGTYTAVIPNAASCDSTITINLQVGQNTTNTIVADACTFYTGPDGNVLSASGIYTIIIPNASGCDSVITLDLTINNTSFVNVTENACLSFTAPDGAVYTSSGSYTVTVPSSAGCDSTIVIDLTINTPTSSTISPSVIDTYTVPSGDETYTTSGTYSDTIPNANGCDSVITINLTVAHTGLDELNSTIVSVYPNPTSGSVQIDGIDQLYGISAMEVYDSRGRLVMKLASGTEVVHMEELEAGAYVLLIHHEAGTERLAIVRK